MAQDSRPGNYFAFNSAAERYVKGRPNFQPRIISQIQQTLQLSQPVPRALDAGCGTGLSTMALRPLAAHIIGTDISEAMLAMAQPDPQITYMQAPAENLPFPNGYFDFITISQAFHWVDQPKFLAESRRVLRKNAFLVIYENHFKGVMLHYPEFHTWFREVFLPRFPRTPRSEVHFTGEEAQRYQFELYAQETFPHLLTFTIDSLIAYFISLSHVIAFIEFGNDTVDSIENWLKGQLQPFFQNSAERQCALEAPIWYLQAI